MKYHKFLLTILLFVLNIYLNAQNRINGIVIDDKTNERLAFVNIVINEDGTLGTTTDIDGNFSIKTKKEINSLTFSFVGYEKKTIDINEGQDNIFVRLKPLNIQLSEIVIDGSHDPANRIIDSVFKYRDSNNPKSLDSYYYKIYDSFTFTVDTTNLSANDEMRKEFEDKDLLVMETVSEQFYHKPNKNKKNILANKISGLNNPMFVYILENIQSIGFQEDFVTINSKNYVNPISKDSRKKYIFVLESSFKNESNDSIFTISFRPYRNTHFNSLKGTITVNSDNWAIQNVKAEPSKQENIFNINIQQMYEKANGYWFPKQLNTNIIMMFPDGNNVGNDGVMLGIGKSYITEISINEDINKKTFDATISIDEKAGESDNIIRNYRYNKLSEERLEATYKYVDSVFKENNINFDKIAESLSFLTENEIPLGFISFRLDDLMDYNIGNGYMLGLGLNTNKNLSKYFSIGANGNYWFKAKEFNYGGNLDFNIIPSKDMRLRISASHQFERLGNYGFEEKKNILNPSGYKHFYIKATSLNDMISAEYSTYINQYLKGFVRFEVGDKIVFNSQQLNANSQQPYRLSTLDFKLRIAFGEDFIKSENVLKSEGNANPVIWLSYQKNLRDVFSSPYNFDKIEFLFRGKNETRYYGETSLTAQLGYINGLAPVTELFNIEGSGNNKFNIYCPESFSTMRPDEFFCDRFAALYFSHNFRNLLINYKKFHPEIILITNIAWGDLKAQNRSDAVIQRLEDSETWGLSDLRKGYYESGIVIDNIIKAGFTKLGFGTFYRYGPYSYEEISDNFVFKINISISL